MSWSEDTRCLFCDGKLPLFRKLSQGQFCSKAHQEAYWKEQDKLAVESLHRTHDALQAYKPSVSIESILGAPAAPAPEAPKKTFVDTDPPMSGLIGQSGRMAATPMTVAATLGADPVEYEMLSGVLVPALSLFTVEAEAEPEGPEQIRHEEEEEAQHEEDAAEAGLLALPEFAAHAAQPHDPAPYEPEFATNLLLLPAPELPLMDDAPEVEMSAAEAVEWNAVDPVTVETVAGDTASIGFREHNLALPEFEAAPYDEALAQAEDEAFPVAEGLFALPLTATEPETATIHQPELLAEPFATATPQMTAELSGAPADFAPVMPATLYNLDPSSPAALEPAIADHGAEPCEFVVEAPLFVAAALTAALPDPRMAQVLSLAGPQALNYPRSLRSSIEAVIFQGPVAQPAMPVTTAETAIRAEATDIKPLDVRDRIQFRAGSYKPRGPVLASPVERNVELPRLRLDADHRTSLLQQAALAGRHTHLVAGIRNFWQQAPRDLKILLFAVPVAIGLAFHPSLPKFSVQAPASSIASSATVDSVVDDATVVAGDSVAAADAVAVSNESPGFFSTQMASIKKAIADRAAIGLDENFRHGLDSWMGNSGSTAEWTFDQAGFVQPGRVALYQPSLGLKDYEVQFLGAIDKGALSWVVRAADFNNYYVVKLVVTKPGVIPQLGVIRYAVIDGKPVDRVDTPVILNTRTDSLYRVSMELQGNHYALTLQGQVIDTWTEPRLKHGGIGFFTNRGEQSRIGWVQVTHQYDTLGRLFAYLAP